MIIRQATEPDWPLGEYVLDWCRQMGFASDHPGHDLVGLHIMFRHL